MKPDKLTMSMLLDCYGDLLTEKQRECFDLYCNQDLTLAEIAELMGTSRQGVHDTITRAETQLLRYEEVTHCLAAQQKTSEVAAALETIAGTLPEQSAAEIRRAAAKLKEI